MSGKCRIVEHMENTENKADKAGVTNDNGKINEHAAVSCRYPVSRNGINYCCRFAGGFDAKNCVKITKANK